MLTCFRKSRRPRSRGCSRLGEIEVDFAKIQDRKNDIVDKMRQGRRVSAAKNKVTVIQRRTRTLSSPNKIEVKGERRIDGSRSRRTSSSRPDPKRSRCPATTVDEKTHHQQCRRAGHDSDSRNRMLIVGAGAVGVEFASIYNSFGTKVTLLEVLAEYRSAGRRRSLEGTETRLHEEGNRSLHEGETRRREAEGWRCRSDVSDRERRSQESSPSTRC